MPSLVHPSSVRVADVRLESPDALFMPDHRIRLPVPGPLYLLSCLQLPVVSSYPTDENGLITDRRYTYQRKEIVYPDGSRFEAVLNGHQARGIPSVYDLDPLLGVLALADQGRVDESGRLIDPTYSDIIEAGRGEPLRAKPSGPQITAQKRGFARWQGASIQTTMELNLAAAAPDPEPGSSYAPIRMPERRERARGHWILEYDVEREMLIGEERDTIHLLRVNPVWLAQSGVGLAAWLSPSVYGRMQNPTMRAMYLHLVVRVAYGWRPARDIRMMDEWIAELGLSSAAKANRDRDRFQKALSEGQALGVVDGFEIREMKRGRYQVDLVPGRVVDDSLFSHRLGTLDPVRTRVLLHHMQRLGISPGEAREYLARYQLRVQEVLQRVHYLRTVRDGLDRRGRPIVAWHLWIGKALEQSWTFEEPEYREWIGAQTDRLMRPAHAPLTAVAETASPTTDEPGPAPAPPLPDDVWGHVLAEFRLQIGDSLFDTWLRPTRLVAEEEERVVVAASSDFAREWIEKKYASELTRRLGEHLERAVRLVLVCESDVPSPPS